MIGNVLKKGLKGILHGAIGATAFGLYTVANLWHPDFSSPMVALGWQTFGVAALTGLSQALGRAIRYDPTKDPANPANAPR